MPRCRTNGSSPSSRPAAPGAGWTSSPASARSPRCRSPGSTSWSTSRSPTSRTAGSRTSGCPCSSRASTLEEQVSNGRPWDLDRNRGGLRLLMPQEGTGSTDEEGFATGQRRRAVPDPRPDPRRGPGVRLVMSADHVYRFDFNDAIDTHASRGRLHRGHTEVDDRRGRRPCRGRSPTTGRVTGSRTSPTSPGRPRSPPRSSSTTRRADRDARGAAPRARRRPTTRRRQGLADFGDHLCRGSSTRQARSRTARRLRRDLGEPHKYLAAHQDVLTDDLGVFDDPAWPILTHHPQRVPARVLDGGSVLDSLLSPGCRVAGTVVRSVLGPGVVVEAGATVRNSVVFADTRRAGRRHRRLGGRGPRLQHRA